MDGAVTERAALDVAAEDAPAEDVAAEDVTAVDVAAVDVAVIGAGPAGSVAAALLARAGRRVALVDRPDDGRARIGESLPAAAERLLRRLDLPSVASDGRHRRVRGTLSAWGGPPVLQDALASPEGPDWRLDRPAFDAGLRAAALAAGAIAVPGLVTGVAGRPAAWRLDVEDGRRVAAAFLVDATGRRAAVARRLGTVRRADPALVAVWATGAPRDGGRGTDRTLIEATPSGWWYGAVLPGGAPLAALHGSPASARRMLADPARWRAALAATEVVGPRLGGAPAFETAVLAACDARGQVAEPPVGRGWAACGDAALAFDPIAAQGLFNALATAADLARAVVGPYNLPTADLSTADVSAPDLWASDVSAPEVSASDRLSAYAARLSEIRDRYRRRRDAAYRRIAAE